MSDIFFRSQHVKQTIEDPLIKQKPMNGPIRKGRPPAGEGPNPLLALRIPPSMNAVIVKIAKIARRDRSSIAMECLDAHLPVLARQYAEFAKIKANGGNGDPEKALAAVDAA